MVSYYYKDNSKKLLRKDKRDDICRDIQKKFEIYYKDLEPTRKDALHIMKAIYPGYAKHKHSHKHILDTYEQYKSYKSAIRNATYKNYDSLVDIEGQNNESNNLASTYKASLIYDYNNINLDVTLDDCQDDWDIKGEASAYVCWKQEIVQVPFVREEPVFEEIVIDETTGETVEEIVDIRMVNDTMNVVEYEAVDIKRIDPFNLFYDKAMYQDWEHCFKMYRTFVPLQKILANQDYKLTKEEKDCLIEEVQKNTNISFEDLEKEQIDCETKFYSGMVEVLECDGDYLIPNTSDIIRRAEITIIAGKYIAQIGQSVKPKCPIVHGVYMRRPDTSRGQAPLKPAYILDKAENRCFDLQYRAWELNVNPVFLAPKGAFAPFTLLSPGKPLEYDPAIFGSQPPQKVDFSSGMRGFDFQQFFKQKMEGATGINQYIQGNPEGAVRTASESTYLYSGGNIRLSAEAGRFQSQFLRPLIKLHALYKKVYDTQDREVPMGDNRYAMVNEQVRTGNYIFLIGNNQTLVEREADIQKLFQLLSLPFFQSLATILDIRTASAFLKWLLNKINFKSTDQLFDLFNLSLTIEEGLEELGIPEDIRPQVKEQVEGFIGDNIPELVQITMMQAQQAEQQPGPEGQPL